MTCLIRKRFKRSVLVIGFFVIAAIALVVVRQQLTLRKYERFIEARYRSEILQLENAMHQWPEPHCGDDACFELKEALRDQLTETFTSGAFYSASWSFDSHHGAKGTPSPDEGYASNPGFRRSEKRRGSLCFAKSTQGTPLLLYEWWIPTAPVMKHVRVVFYLDRLDKAMKLGQRQ